MPRSFCIPGIFFLLAATVLLIITSINLPYLTALDFARVHYTGNSLGVSGGQGSLTQLRFGIWGYCAYTSNGARVCPHVGHGYGVEVLSTTHNSATINPSWTRGLAVHPVAAVVSFIALLFSFSTHVTVTLVASVLSFLAALLALLAFIIDIALYAWVKHEMGNLGVPESTITGPGFWLTFVAMILLFLAGCTVCFGRRRDRMSGATSYEMSGPKTGFFSRFRRN
ncbi:pali-domain-containing protein [Coniophora puteana RWD-64-598 SS2]|uniref:Pali-domain-containing protein n=1 Tax=Coniophora puteana (strain RWD-64-598) TaxID=741705 RepID=A0A5M3ME44_CONPW|nr:pali-domain-containing protein [Coniophora puteana RWD-64-598 SS2]EIW76851.1 pali-domain-containing protein [Coniophora puteana RWD-64-598 SS2]